MKILFICHANVDRSPTAERIIRKDYPDIETKSAGIAPSAAVCVDNKLIHWADVVLCMEAYQKEVLERDFKDALIDKELASLNIQDYYSYMSPELVQLIKEKFQEWQKEYMARKAIE
ncbi:MAG: hypothetical protein LBH04_02640 [Tannerellaceae bacterium]|jgi:predicted protein tyrosine phosphatase|nr:hypothetical protein [Tannerellaceae bacterium]